MERKPHVMDGAERVATTVRVGVLCWAGAILTTSYLNLGKPSADLTFPASVFSAALASFGIERANGDKDKKLIKRSPSVSKATTSSSK